MTTQSLAQIVSARRKRLKMSLREVADASGGLVSKSNLAAIERGSIRNVSDDTIDGLVVSLGLSDAAVRRAARLSTEDLGPFELPARARRLNERERKLVLAVVDTLLAAHRK